MPEHVCTPGDGCQEYAEGAEHSAFHYPGQYSAEVRKGCPLCELRERILAGATLTQVRLALTEVRRPLMPKEGT